MNCRHILKCYLSVIVALLFAPQPKVMASTFNGCEATLYEMVPDDIVILDAVDIFGTNLVERIGTQDQPLPTNSPYKSNSSKDVIWRMRVLQSDYDSYLSQSGRSIAYTANQYQPTRLTVEAVPGSVRKYQDCQNNTSVLIEGQARFIFGELNKWKAGNYRPPISVCIPGIRC